MERWKEFTAGRARKREITPFEGYIIFVFDISRPLYINVGDEEQIASSSSNLVTCRVIVFDSSLTKKKYKKRKRNKWWEPRVNSREETGQTTIICAVGIWQFSLEFIRQYYDDITDAFSFDFKRVYIQLQITSSFMWLEPHWNRQDWILIDAFRSLTQSLEISNLIRFDHLKKDTGGCVGTKRKISSRADLVDARNVSRLCCRAFRSLEVLVKVMLI